MMIRKHPYLSWLVLCFVLTLVLAVCFWNFYNTFYIFTQIYFVGLFVMWLIRRIKRKKIRLDK